MRHLALAFLLSSLFAYTIDSTTALGRGGGHGGSVSVRGYTKKDGTYVAPHERSAPDGNFDNNWSTKGNVNPYTGEEGTRVTPPSRSGSSNAAAAEAVPAPTARPQSSSTVSAIEQQPLPARPSAEVVAASVAGGRRQLAIEDLTANEQASISAACLGERGKSKRSYRECSTSHLTELQNAPFRPDMSKFSPETRATVEGSCAAAREKGPATYNACLGRELQALLQPR